MSTATDGPKPTSTDGPKPIDMGSPLGQQLLARGGRLESGSIFSARTRIPSETIHVRISGEADTLCGRRLRDSADSEFRWVWYAIGRFAEYLPCYARGKDHYHVCSACARHPVYQITKHISDAKSRLLVTGKAKAA